VPLVQASRSRALRLAPTTDVKALMADNAGKYDIALDPVWNGEFGQEAEPFGKDEIAFYQCDYLGTPQELTDQEGKVAWSAQYKAWGKAKEAISAAARRAGIRSPIRFQGQYEDAETGLFYNRHRYYDPDMARYLSQDPIRLMGGGINLYSYPMPTAFVDPLGLVRTRPTDPAPGSLSDLETRCWYLKQESMISCQINRSQSLKQQARQAHRLRNEARIRARLLMEDRQKAIGLYTGSTTGKPEPMLTWKQTMAKAESKDKTGSEAYEYILGSAQQSRGSVNKNVIGDADCDQVLASLQKKFGCH
jgi:RHS repeat-associated protein